MLGSQLGASALLTDLGPPLIITAAYLIKCNQQTVSFSGCPPSPPPYSYENVKNLEYKLCFCLLSYPFFNSGVGQCPLEYSQNKFHLYVNNCCCCLLYIYIKVTLYNLLINGHFVLCILLSKKPNIFLFICPLTRPP